MAAVQMVRLRESHCPWEYRSVPAPSRVLDALTGRPCRLLEVRSAYRVVILIDGAEEVRSPAHLRAL